MVGVSVLQHSASDGSDFGMVSAAASAGREAAGSLGSATAGGDGGSAVRDGWQPDNQANEHETMTLTHRRSILLNSHIVFDRLQDQVLVVVKT